MVTLLILLWAETWVGCELAGAVVAVILSNGEPQSCGFN